MFAQMRAGGQIRPVARFFLILHMYFPALWIEKEDVCVFVSV